MLALELTPFIIRTVIDVVFSSVENHPDVLELRSLKYELTQSTLETVEALLDQAPTNLGEQIVRTRLRSVLARHGIHLP